MHCLRAAVALIAAVVFPLNVAGQTSRGIAIYTERAGGLVPATPFQPLTTLTKTIKRYGDPNKGDLKIIVGAVEYNRVDCSFIESGTWTDPNPVQAKDKNGNLVTLGTVDATQTFKANISGTGTKCDGVGPYDFRAIKFIWTLHRNLTGIPNQGPTAVFNSTWSTKDHCCDTPFTFNISVPVVRPIGETNTFKDFRTDIGVYGRWMVTLTPPGDDPTFDFKDEVVREVLTGVNTCNDRAPGAQGKLPPGSELGNGGTGPSQWTVGKLLETRGTPPIDGPNNAYGYDFVGWDYCAIEAYRCAGITGIHCGNELTQIMQIKSPADDFFADYTPPYSNILISWINGQILLPPNPNANGIGQFQSRRGDGGLRTYPEANSNIHACSGWQIATSKALLHCGGR
ncbi:MAG TPA: hypothetical protein VIF02_09285 [Methylocella sp.]|jgi:hypothetical protein